MRTSSRLAVAIALPLSIVIAACSAGAGASPTGSPGGATQTPTEEPYKVPTAAPSAEAPASEAPSPEAPADAAVQLADHALGRILVDGAGRTLYGFTNDVDGVPSCYEACADAWPPVLAGDGEGVGDGLDASLLTTASRTDGSTQLRYGDWPLYWFAADSAPGDANGQGVGGNWFVIDADGALIGQ